MASHRLVSHPADSSRRRIGYNVPEAMSLRLFTSEPESSSVGFSRNASSTLSVWSEIRTLRSLPILVSLHRGRYSVNHERSPRAIAGARISGYVRSYDARVSTVAPKCQHPRAGRAWLSDLPEASFTLHASWLTPFSRPDRSLLVMEPYPKSRSPRVVDPRHYQAAVLAALLVFGAYRLDFDVPLGHIAAILTAALIAQVACTWFFRLPRFDPRSALISALSLCLLLRSNSYLVLIAAATIAITSKFLLRRNGKHVFNPSNLALAVCVALGGAWLSPAQWGSTTWFAFALACLGGLVVNRAERADIALSFLACYVGLLFSRALWLGDPLAIPLKQMQSGALLLFAFFMISDPRTTPADARARIFFAVAVSIAAFVLQFHFYSPNALIYALVLLCPLTIVLDRLFPALNYRWPLNMTRGLLR